MELCLQDGNHSRSCLHRKFSVFPSKTQTKYWMAIKYNLLCVDLEREKYTELIFDDLFLSRIQVYSSSTSILNILLDVV